MTPVLWFRVTTILGVRDRLKFVLGREKVAKPKPDPSIYLAAAKALGVSPERFSPTHTLSPPLLPTTMLTPLTMKPCYVYLTST
jgi:hypothetical protein